MNPVSAASGDSPIVLGMPHAGTWLPDDVLESLNENGRRLADTDWHIDRLYSGLLPGATIVKANFHRYVIDANRDPSGASLYPGHNTTSLCPLTDFDGRAIYRAGREPDATEIAQRRSMFHASYHAALAAEVARVKASHGVAILYDCHSIRSRIPFLFKGTLPDFNIGTNDGTTCARAIETAIAAICASASGYSSVVNGRFRGGWTTRHYGQPANGVHAIQMELAQATHLKTERLPFDYDEAKATALHIHLTAILKQINMLAQSGMLSLES